MIRLAAAILILSLLAVSGGAQEGSAPPPLKSVPPATTGAATQPRVVRFVPVDVFIDPLGKAMACYQVEIITATGNVKLVGVEGGEDANFNQAPYYDPRALQNGERVIIGAYSLASNLQTGKTRVARLMFQVTGPIEPRYQATLQVAGSSDEKSIPAVVSLVVPSPKRAGIAKAAFAGGLE
jgi:hypothetical protein